MKKLFSIREALGFGWSKTRAHSGLIFQTVLTLFALQVVSAIVDKTLQETFIGGLAAFVLVVLGVYLGTGVMVIALKLARGDHAEYRDILPHTTLVWKYFCASVVSGFLTMLPMAAAGVFVAWQVISTVGYEKFRILIDTLEAHPETAHNTALFLLTSVSTLSVVVGVIGLVASAYLALRYFMVRFAAVDGSGITESLRTSTAMTHDVKWHLLGFVLALVLLNIVGALLLLVGLLITLPVSMLAYAHVYLKLKNRA